MKQILLLLAFIAFIFLSLELTLHLSSNILIVANKIVNKEFVQSQKNKRILLIKFFKDANKFIENKTIGIIKKWHI